MKIKNWVDDQYPKRRDIEEHLERGFLSPWFGLGPSMGKHERSMRQMQQDIHSPFKKGKWLADGGGVQLTDGVEKFLDGEYPQMPFSMRRPLDPAEMLDEHFKNFQPVESDNSMEWVQPESGMQSPWAQPAPHGIPPDVMMWMRDNKPPTYRMQNGGSIPDRHLGNTTPYGAMDPPGFPGGDPSEPKGFSDILPAWGNVLGQAGRSVSEAGQALYAMPQVQRFIADAPGYPDRKKFPPMTAGQVGKKWLGTAKDIGAGLAPTIQSYRKQLGFRSGGRSPFSFQSGGDVRPTDDPDYEEKYWEAMPGVGEWRRQRRQSPADPVVGTFGPPDEQPQAPPQAIAPQANAPSRDIRDYPDITAFGETYSSNPNDPLNTIGNIYGRQPTNPGKYPWSEDVPATNEMRARGNNLDVTSGLASREDPPLTSASNYMADVLMRGGMHPYQAHHIARGLGNSIFKTFIPGVTTIPSGAMLGSEIGRAVRPGVDAAFDDSREKEIYGNLINSKFKAAYKTELEREAKKLGVETNQLSPYVREKAYDRIRATDPTFQSGSSTQGDFSVTEGLKNVDWPDMARIAAEGVLGVYGRSQVPFRFPELKGRLFNRLGQLGKPPSENLASSEHGMVRYNNLRANDFPPGPHAVEVRPTNLKGTFNFRDTPVDPGHFTAGKPLSHDIFVADKSGVSKRIATIETSNSRQWGPFWRQSPMKVNRIVVDAKHNLTPEQINSALEQIGPIYQSRSIRGGNIPVVPRTEPKKGETAPQPYVKIEPRNIESSQYSWGPYEWSQGKVMPQRDQLAKALHEVRGVRAPQGFVGNTKLGFARQTPEGNYYSDTPMASALTPERVAQSREQAKRTMKELYNTREQEREVPAFMQRLYGYKDGGRVENKPFWDTESEQSNENFLGLPQ